MAKFDLDTEVSVFKTITSIDPPSQISVGDVLNDIISGRYKSQIDRLRGGDLEVKTSELPAIAFHGMFNGRRRKDNFYNQTGILIVDIDDITTNIEDVKQEIADSLDSCLAIMVSPSGDGLKCLYLIDDSALNRDNYTSYGREVKKLFERFGTIDVLSITDCLIMTYDPNMFINFDAIPDSIIQVRQVEVVQQSELPKRDSSKPLFEDIEEFYETVLLDEIDSRASNNFDFIRMSIFELAKYGFHHPNEDLSFVIDFSETCHKVSKSNKARLRESSEKAKSIQQSAWAYDTRGSLSTFEVKSKPKQVHIPEKNDDEPSHYSEDDGESSDSEDENDEYDWFVDKSNFLSRIMDTVNEGDRVGAEISFPNFADNFRFKYGLCTVTGIPTSGKTEFLDAITIDLARLHGWDTCVAGFEQTPEEHVVKLLRKVIGHNITSPTANKSEISNAYKFVMKHYTHVDIEKTGGDINKILKCFQVMADLGYKSFVLDPFNLLTIKSRGGELEKISEILRKITMFANTNKVYVFLIAHPRKMSKNDKTGKPDIPDFYSVKGSSAFFEMSYHGLVVHRDDESETPVLVRVLKVKQNNLGRRDANMFFKYSIGSGRYIPLTEDGDIIRCDYNIPNWHLLI